jgi:O-antigen/teichoic acid export membrane protein
VTWPRYKQEAIKRFLKIFDSESKLLAKNSSWLLLSTIYQAAIAFVKSVVIARSLGIEQYGTYAVLFAFVSTFQEIFNLNFGAALIKYSADFRKQERPDKALALIKAGYLVSGAAALISVMCLPLLLLISYNVFFAEPGLELLVMVFAASSSLAFFNTMARVILRIHNKFKVNSIVNIVIYSLEIATICGSLYFYRNNMTALVLSLSAVNVISFVVCNATAFWEVSDKIVGFWNEPLSKLKEERKAMTGFLLNNSLSMTLHKLMKKGDVLILAAFAGPAQVGLYDVARKLAFSLLVIKDPITLAVYPQIADLIAQGKIKKMKRFLTSIMTLSAIPFVLGVIVLFFLDEWIIGLVYGKEFIGAGIALQYLMGVIGLEIVCFWTVPYILSLGKTGFRLRASLVSSALTIIVALLLAPIYGATGIAFSILIGGVLLQVAFLVVVYRHLKASGNG